MSTEVSHIKKAAYLARISIDNSSLEATAGSIEKILELAGRLQSIDTTQIEPLSHPLDVTQRLRQDQISETNQREKLQSCAPAVEEGLFLVPKVIE